MEKEGVNTDKRQLGRGRGHHFVREGEEEESLARDEGGSVLGQAGERAVHSLTDLLRVQGMEHLERLLRLRINPRLIMG